jgi:tetratricopeptide (TPR) repeat protein
VHSADPFAILTRANILSAVQHASALQSGGRVQEAAELWRKIATAAPANAEAQFNLAASLLALERFAESERAFRSAVALKPEAAFMQHRLGNILQATGRWTEAEPHYLAALERDPELWRARLDLAHLHLGHGNFSKGWPLYEARRAVLGEEHLSAPPLANEWQGEPLPGRKLLVWPEQGFGDQIQFARFVPELAARGADVTLVAPPELSALFGGLGVRVVERAPTMELPEPDYWTFLLSAPHHLGVRLETLSGQAYLTAPPDRRARWAGFAPKGGVGVVWTGRATPNPHRSLPSRDVLQPLADAGARLVDLQPEPGDDFADLAAVMEQLDLVVTIDTAAAHLAGALGKPCWVLLPWLNNDWRWMQGRDDSPWYGSARLFRQRTHGDWAGVVADVVKAWGERT